MIAGVVCVLGDVRDYRTCATGSPGILRVTVEETRQQTMTDVAGHFSLPLSQKLDDRDRGRGRSGGQLRARRSCRCACPNGVANNVALPVVSAADAHAASSSPTACRTIRSSARCSAGPSIRRARRSPACRGNNARALRRQRARQPARPARDAPGRHHRAVHVTPTTLMLTLTPPPTAPLSSDTFTVPIRSGAVTATTLVLPPR